MLSMLAAGHMKFQPDEMLRILDRRFNGGVVDPLLLGNRDQWMAVYTHALTSVEHEGSNAATGKVSRASVEKAADCQGRPAYSKDDRCVYSGYGFAAALCPV